VMVIEKQNGSVLVHLGPKLQAYPEELVSQRHGHNRQTEYLIRWHVLSSENGSGSTTSTSLIESKMENILMWMPADDVSANCPTLLGKRKPKKQQLEQRASHIFSPEVTLDEASLLEMKKDVKNLVQRASWQMESSMVPQSSILNTIHVLSAYASIPSLMGVFKETGALDLLMKMLCHTEKQIRCSAGKMLRALASHDAGSRAYVLLSLSQQDGIEQHMDFDSRCTLLELFAETTSSEEHGMSFEGIPLPQIPGKLLFSLVKLYLCATFLLDKLNSTADASSEGKKKLLREFDFSMAMAHLISELVRVMGWDHGLNLRHCRAKQPRGIQSIFQRQIPTCASIPSDTPLNHKEESTFKSRSAFPSRNCYMEYLKEKLVHGMRVRMLESYEKVSAGDEGEFLQSNNGTPPLQVYWESLGRTYWVHWHMVEIVDSSRCADQEAQKMVSSLTQILREDTVYYKPLGGLYSLLYLRDQINEESGNLNRAEWWELLFFVKKLELSKQQELLEFIQQNQKMSELDEEGLIQLSVSVELAQQVLRILNNHCQGCTRSDLQSSQVYLKYSTGKQRTEQNCQHVNGVPANCDGFSEDLPSKKPKKKLVSKIVKRLVELLSYRRKEEVFMVLALQVLYRLMAKYDWRILFASQGGLSSVLHCMQEHPMAAPVQQAGLAVLKVLLGAGNCDLSGACRKPYPLDHFAVQMMQEIFANIGSSSSKDPDNLLRAIPALAAPLNTKDMNLGKLVSNLRANFVCKEIVEHCLCAWKNHPEEDFHEFLLDVLLLIDLANLGSEKDVQLEVLRILNKCLDNSQKESGPWHKTIEPCLSSMNIHINDREIIQKFTHFLYRLATLNKDCAVLMCCMGAQDILTKVVEKHSSSLLWVTELREILGKCEKYASLYKTMTVSILAGCIQVNLGFLVWAGSSTYQPFFDVFLHNLCQGCSMEVKEDKCWEKIEVSSNPQMASKLTDGNSKTFWESNGSTGSHYINVYMHHGVVVQYMSLLVASEDASYMPARIMVKGGESASSISTKLNMVSIPPLASKVILLENMSCFWPIIQIKIKRCQQGGIDTRVHGLKVLGPKPTVWPIFKEQLCRRTSLFYTTKAHTWCQEISEDRMQLLHLFNRLNSALRHEQVFADHFLPHDEAAQALGKTCWEALITPVVQSITSPDPSGISPLSWLLSQYLENLEIARKAKSRAAIFNSRVRRLSHLLVHSDSSSPEPEELKPPNEMIKESSSGAAKTVVNKPSSTTDITQCWKGVVQQQVKWFLETSWQTSNFVEQYCNTYLRLRTAMEELFGQQMSFMLALRHGFSGALLQLSFLRAMHVSEQFARYIDRWIRESWGDSGNVETLWHLQQSLEPILFLAGLELANTFEHFYRLYLGDRLLSQGKSWLECAVVEHIGLCFPNRLPQQMLKSLSELEEQQQQFHLFQLQQLDKRLLEFDHDGKYLFCFQMKKDEESFSHKEETEVKVLVLSPRCWTISPHCYLEEPANFFPSSLSQQLDRFADFYTQSQSRFGLEHTNLRHFQWTWLGHAELEYQGCKLHVSTLQMYILLCFNSAQEVSVKTLLQVTGLCPVLLNHALKTLVKENGILCQSHSKYGRLSGQHLWLLPRPEYLNVGGDEGHTLKKKRDIICSLLIQILKEEKEIHIDKLLFKVIDAYQKREHGSTPRLTGVFFSSADVLSCILHLLNQGSAQRKENHPEFLEYVSTECSTQVLPKNQLQATFQTVQIKKVCNVPSVEKRQTFSTFSEHSQFPPGKRNRVNCHCKWQSPRKWMLSVNQVTCAFIAGLQCTCQQLARYSMPWKITGTATAFPKWAEYLVFIKSRHLPYYATDAEHGNFALSLH
uniref:Cullin 7 n=1 Tax=Anolis carolinensis TaxID=28377 RepID=A0A803U089_ANOCA